MKALEWKVLLVLKNESRLGYPVLSLEYASREMLPT